MVSMYAVGRSNAPHICVCALYVLMFHRVMTDEGTNVDDHIYVYIYIKIERRKKIKM